MTDIVNSNGSATYSVDVPEPIVVLGAGNVYKIEATIRAGRGAESYIVENAEQAERMRKQAAELIAVADAYDWHRDREAEAARDRLAELLYQVEHTDADDPKPGWQDALPATRRRLENKADALRILGVTAGA